jgi:tetratricopeptide (TPR) repeat protein
MVQRTRIDPPASGVLPELWLRNAYLELQKIFLTFEGYMMVSMILGLVDEKTGTLYYINAEHPLAILYRNNEATLLHHEQASTYKLGVHDADRRFRVAVTRLIPGDILIVGSDGRDDVIVGQDLQGKKIVNDDESRFLRIVERSEGNLEKIVENLLNEAEVRDDLSLLRVIYIGDDSAQPEIEISDHKQLAIQYKENKDYNKAAFHMKRLADLQPWREDYLYQTSYFMKKAGLLDEAILFGESLRIRNPVQTKNNINLADLYRMVGKDHRARHLLDDALVIDPDHVAANRLASLLKVQDQEP